MKKQSLAAGVLVWVIAVPAFAQNSYVPDWTGYYLGANAGIGWDRAKVSYGPADNAGMPGFFKAIVHDSPIIGGAQFGYNDQLDTSDKWVIGFEGDAEFGIRSANLILGPPSPPAAILLCPPPPPGTRPPTPIELCKVASLVTERTRSVERTGDVSMRLRTGFAQENVLIYVTAGIAITNARVAGLTRFTRTETPRIRPFIGEQNGPDPQANIVIDRAAFGTDNKNLLGWSLGLGGEISVNHSISLAFEYRHSDYGRHTYSFNPVFSGDGAQSLGAPDPTSVAVTDDRATLRVNYHFQGP